MREAQVRASIEYPPYIRLHKIPESLEDRRPTWDVTRPYWPKYRPGYDHPTDVIFIEAAQPWLVEALCRQANIDEIEDHWFVLFNEGTMGDKAINMQITSTAWNKMQCHSTKTETSKARIVQRLILNYQPT